MKLSLLAAIATLWATAAAAQPLDVAGNWMTNRRGAVVTIADCGDATPCGHIVWLAPTKAGRAADIRNPDPSLRSRAIMGLTIVWGFVRRDDGWTAGRMYNPETGQTFDAMMTLDRDGRLRVKGCLGPLCLTRYWTRPPGERAEAAMVHRNV